MPEPERPYITFGETDRPASEEHHDAVELLVRDVLSRLSTELAQAVLNRSQDVVPIAARQVMDKAYRPLPGELRLMGPTEIADHLGVKRQRVSQIRQAPSTNFPSPVAELKMGPVWLAEDIETWAKTWPRKIGNPGKKRE